MIDPNDQQDGAPRARVNGRRNGDVPDDRVRKLEAAVTELEAKVTEDAITERVLAKLAVAPPPPAPGGVLFDATGAVAPTALALVAPSPGPTMSTPLPPSGAVLHPPVFADPSHRAWFLSQLWSELRLTVRMYFDPRYRISRTAQFLLPAILGLFALNYFLFAVWFAVPVVSPVLERVGCVLLGVFLYKAMTRELTRYREVLDYLARYGRQ
ncbi:MAG: hypothetical protein JWO38_3917 [Gemmataceae bacterium]|nr:hypothetical protein [Gemmataceae bacterium]